MANESEWTVATQVTLEASGGACNNAAFVQADDANLTTANHSNYPYADFQLYTTGFGAALSSAGNLTVNLWQQPLNFDGTNDEPSPSASLKAHFAGAFVLPLSAASNSAYYAQINDVNIIPGDAAYWLENSLGQTLNAGWTLKCIPKTLVPGA